MQKNVGGTDKTARLVGGSLLLLAGLLGYTGQVTLAFGPFPQALVSIVFAVIGLILIVTVAAQRCYVNKTLGRNTHNG